MNTTGAVATRLGNVSRYIIVYLLFIYYHILQGILKHLEQNMSLAYIMLQLFCG